MCIVEIKFQFKVAFVVEFAFQLGTALVAEIALTEIASMAVIA